MYLALVLAGPLPFPTAHISLLLSRAFYEDVAEVNLTKPKEGTYEYLDDTAHIKNPAYGISREGNSVTQNPAYGISKEGNSVTRNPAYGISKEGNSVTRNPAYGISKEGNSVTRNPAYGISKEGNLYEYLDVTT